MQIMRQKQLKLESREGLDFVYKSCYYAVQCLYLTCTHLPEGFLRPCSGNLVCRRDSQEHVKVIGVILQVFLELVGQSEGDRHETFGLVVV